LAASFFTAPSLPWPSTSYGRFMLVEALCIPKPLFAVIDAQQVPRAISAGWP